MWGTSRSHNPMGLHGLSYLSLCSISNSVRCENLGRRGKECTGFIKGGELGNFLRLPASETLCSTELRVHAVLCSRVFRVSNLICNVNQQFFACFPCASCGNCETRTECLGFDTERPTAAVHRARSTGAAGPAEAHQAVHSRHITFRSCTLQL
jgi:hypothetical protein